MTRILDIFLDRKANSICDKFLNQESLFNALNREEDEAIRCLYARISGSVFKIGKSQQLTDDDIEELICDCITLCIQKIRDGKYVFQGYDPATFVIEIAKNKARNFRRSVLRFETADIEQMVEPTEESEMTSRDETELLENLLAKLDLNCQKLIRLKYLEELHDKEVIVKKLTQYTTIDSLKNQRAKCMKKLSDIAATTFR
jgi:DNA-directed RNA polymerase specialized sigma24 family protein